MFGDLYLLIWNRCFVISFKNTTIMKYIQYFKRILTKLLNTSPVAKETKKI